MPSTKTAADTLANALPHALPDDVAARIALLGIRRLGAHGLHDANAAYAYFASFGEGFRRPLVLMRNFMADIACAATGPIPIAPCCCSRMTSAENTLLSVLTRVERQPEHAMLLLTDLLGTRAAEGVLASAHAVAGAFADCGRPIAG
jgi:hypothetical protein